MPPHVQPCKVMVMDTRVCLSTCQARTAVLGSQGWIEGWKVIPSKTSPSRNGHECLLGTIF